MVVSLLLLLLFFRYIVTALKQQKRYTELELYYQYKQREAKERAESIRHEKDEEIHKLRADMDSMRRDFQRQMRDKVCSCTSKRPCSYASRMHVLRMCFMRVLYWICRGVALFLCRC